MPLFARVCLVAIGAFFCCVPALAQDEPPSAVGPFMKLLKSGKLPEERRATVVKMVCQRGNEHDLAYVFQQATTGDDYPLELKLMVLEQLIDAAETRKVKPHGDLTSLGKLIATPGPTQLPAVRLVGAWGASDLAGDLEKLAVDPQAEAKVQAAALGALTHLGGDAAAKTIRSLTAPGRPVPVRVQAAAALVKIDPEHAPAEAAKVLADAKAEDDPGALLDAFLNMKGGSEKLATALAAAKLSPDAGKRALRHVFSVGRSDAELVNVLSNAAGIATDAPPPTQEQVAALAKEVEAQGDAARGELVFRRGDVNCIKCHAISRAGGSVGPDLSAVGSISPVDYIVNSILLPDLAIKEVYVTKIIETVDGEIFQGIVIDRDDQRINLRDATGKTITIAAGDVEDEYEGKSLMPMGLTKFLTHQEFLDLSKFVSELGKPGPYAIRGVPTIQRWRVLKEVSPKLAEEIPNVEIFREFVIDLPAEAWTPAYGKTAGALPLDELTPVVSGSVLYLQGEVDVVTAGPVTLNFDSPDGVAFWLDAEPFTARPTQTLELTAGRRKLTFRVDRKARASNDLRVELARPDGAATQYEVVGGQ